MAKVFIRDKIVFTKKRGPGILVFFCLMRVLAVLVAVFVSSALISCKPNSGSSESEGITITFSGATMGTTYHIKAYLNQSLGLEKEALHQIIDDDLVNFNQIMSTYIADSELSLLNRAPAHQWIALSPPLWEVLSISREVAKYSEGAFDPTVGPLVNVWGFGPNKRISFPSEEEIEAAKALTGFKRLSFDDESRRVMKLGELYLDLSAIAKGYATDVLGDLLEAYAIKNYMVEIGGELKIRGVNGTGGYWTIGVERPSLAHDGAMLAISGDNVGIATSGDYRNYYEEDGIRASHTIDPNTGKPITHSLASITVIAESAAMSDAYATAINVMGPDFGFEFAETHHMAAYFIVREGGVFKEKYTSEFRSYIVEG